jgi:hypothetical protein
LAHPYGIAVDSSGVLYIADLGNAVVRKVRHPPQSGWLDELGRLKGGWPVGLGVARCAPH